MGDCYAIIRACVTIVLENEFSHIVPQSRQSSIAPTLFALLKPSAVVSSREVMAFGVFFVGALPLLFIEGVTLRGRRQSRDSS